MMAAIIILRIPCQEFSHYRGNALLATLKQNMQMIAHEHPGVDRTLALSNIAAYALQK